MHGTHLYRRRLGARSLVVVALALLLLSVAPPPDAVAEKTFTFSGSGWGHSLGMSQWGARGLAEVGTSAKDILNNYYAGTNVASRAMPSEVRVGVLWNFPGVIEVQGTSTMEFVAGSFVATVPAGQTWSVTATSGGKFWIRRSDGSTAGTVGSPSEPLSLRYEEFGSIVKLFDTGRRYRYGSLEFNVYDSGGYQ
ncbi:MAG: hypothetical protein ACRD1T_03040, partial [Acidimicrobiia bacterium]